jgi:hypothetical protein
MYSLVKWKDSWIESSSIQEVDEHAGMNALIQATANDNITDGMIRS